MNKIPYLGYDDDNYGQWDEPEDEEDRIEKLKFREQVQKDSEYKTCVLCDREVFLRRSYDKCNSCMEKLERGMEW
tara:strand:- start:1254 stop:1478 length:225 start_codon:yes stop_codon:yes gene_type:complete